MPAAIRIKRVFDPASPDDGTRVLVERLWPRGMTREKIQSETWLREIAPSTALREWYEHDPRNWDDFVARYREQLDGQHDLVEVLLSKARSGPLTLLYVTHDADHNSTQVLLAYLKEHLKAK
jgi:uncharacterized protein YeaO (DUF488 family)